MSTSEPPRKTLEAFGIDDTMVPLSGGRSLCYATGNSVLKPSDDDEESEWVGNLLWTLCEKIAPTEYRVPMPISDINNPHTFVINGWTAMSLLSGSIIEPCRFEDILRVSRAFHRDLAKLNPSKPRFLTTRLNRWCEADRVIWGEKRLDEVALVSQRIVNIFGSSLTKYSEMTRPLPAGLSSQLIHADLRGNILFDDEGGASPGIIDMTFYWRPAAYAEAIVVADGLAWHKQGRKLVLLYGTDDTRLQLLVRALHWRCLTFAIDPILGWVRENICKVDYYGAACLLEEMMKKNAGCE